MIGDFSDPTWPRLVPISAGCTSHARPLVVVAATELVVVAIALERTIFRAEHDHYGGATRPSGGDQRKGCPTAGPAGKSARTLASQLRRTGRPGA